MHALHLSLLSSTVTENLSLLCSCSFPLVVPTQFVGLKQSITPRKSNAVTCALEITQCMELSLPHPSYRMKDNWRLWYLCIKIIHHTRAAAERRGCKYCIKVISGLVPSLPHHMCITFPVQICSSFYFLPFLVLWLREASLKRSSFQLLLESA